MKLVHCNLTQQILLENFGITRWIIENPRIFAVYVQELYLQSEGTEGRFVLSEGDKELAIEKKMEMIMNPLQINVNNRKILNKLYSKLSEIAYTDHNFLETQRIMNQFQTYFYQLEQECEYMLEIEKDITMTELFKVMGVQVLKLEEDYFSNCIQYLKLCAGLLEKSLLVIVNATAYFSEAQIQMIQETAVYEEIRILFIECQKKELDFKVPEYIIDIDMCEI